jgi:hypothetical protein
VSKLPTGEKDSGLLPTPRANEPGRTTKGYGRGLAELVEGKKQIEPKMWLTPSASMRANRSEEAMKHRVEYRKSIGRTTVPPGNLAEQVQYGEPTTDMKIWRTPTTMDSKEDSLKHATKLLQGKNLRSTGSRIQITLADEVMAQEIVNNPELMEQYKDYEMMTRKNLPEQQEFVDYMREQTSVKELHEKTGITKTTVEHWFRRDKAGFSHPSVEDWNAIKIHFKNLKYDNVMTALHSIEWKQEEMKIWRTPDAHCNRGPSSVKRMKMKLEKGMPISINDQVAHPDLMWPTPRASAAKHPTMWASPKVSDANTAHMKENEKGIPHDVAKRNLRGMVKMWSTPVQDDVHHRKQKYSQGGTALSTQAGGSLNPTWVEWLMGYPGGYTDLSHWEILSSRKSSKRSATPSSKLKEKKS